jgi:hypothetical protein
MLIDLHRVGLINLQAVLKNLRLVGLKSRHLVPKSLLVGHLENDLHRGDRHQTRESPLLAGKGLLQEL